jgi:hypothetical protein
MRQENSFSNEAVQPIAGLSRGPECVSMLVLVQGSDRFVTARQSFGQAALNAKRLLSVVAYVCGFQCT